MKKTKENSFTPILILAIIIVLVGVGYFGYKNLYTRLSTAQTTVDTTNWKSFTSSLYGFTFEYPAIITPPVESPINTSITPPSSGFMEFSLPENQDSLSIKVWRNPSGLDIHAWITKTREEQQRNNANLVLPESEKDVLINGVVAYQSVNFAGDGNMKDTYFVNGKYVIEISFYDTNSNIQDHAKNKAIFEKMLSTFKFTQ